MSKNNVKYVDGFLIPILKKKVPAYCRMAAKAGKIWRDHGALDYKECVGDDQNVKFGMPFPRLARLKRGETVVFSYIGYRSRAHRDKVNARVMKDPRLREMCDPKDPPFDLKRMVYGGFNVIVA